MTLGDSSSVYPRICPMTLVMGLLFCFHAHAHAHTPKPEHVSSSVIAGNTSTFSTYASASYIWIPFFLTMILNSWRTSIWSLVVYREKVRLYDESSSVLKLRSNKSLVTSR